MGSGIWVGFGMRIGAASRMTRWRGFQTIRLEGGDEVSMIPF